MAKNYLMYVGTYTQTTSPAEHRAEGIFVFRFDAETGALERLSSAGGALNPSFLALHPKGRFLYAVGEISDYQGKESGAVHAYARDPATGALTHLNRQSSVGTGPCHLSVEGSGRYALAANYGSGSVLMLPIRADGSLGEATDFVQHQGSSVNPQRQEGPHAHSIMVSPDNRFAFAPDLGLDKVLCYRLDLERGKLVANDPPGVQVAPGAGPRHFDFHPNGRWAYLINEIGNTLSAYAYDAARGALTLLNTVPTLPAGFSGTSHTADIHVHPSGKFVYGSNRGHDSITICAIDQGTGQVSVVGQESTQGKSPRNFAIDPTGTFLLAANQPTGNIVVFRIDAQNGRLSPTGHSAQAPAPVCLKLIPA
ncbi:MAG: lactonase family protein [Candidatus Latescibacteria bacterium]|nr:lactonase family protein [Candidatus Latescibacterota bacterium]